MKLKTLRDLIEPTAGEGHSTTNTIRKIQLQFVDGLKQEAIKWIKYFNSEEHNWKNYEPIDDWIKDFFNITEEDLK